MSGGAGLRPGQRAMLEERIRGSLVRCEGVRDRFVEMGERHRGHIGQVSCVCRAIIQGLEVVVLWCGGACEGTWGRRCCINGRQC